MWQGYRVIDGDAHHHEPPYLWDRYVESAFQDPDEPGLDQVVDFLGEDSIIWNTDYPHPDAPDPDKVLPWFEAQPISREQKQKILWDNSVRLYGPRLVQS